MTWQPISTAPRSAYVTTEYETAKGPRKRTDMVPVWVWTWRRDGHMTPSYWIPDGHEDGGGRWNGYTRDAPPDMWHQYKPDPPEGV
jgi:hypothetical protein